MRKLISIIGLLTLVAACATRDPQPAKDNLLAREFAAPPTGSLIILLPRSGKLDTGPGERFVRQQLGLQLKSAGYQVALLERSNYEQVWAQEVKAVGGLFDPQTGASRQGAYALAMSELARRICAEKNCTMVIQSELVRRGARLQGTTAEWDGQRKPIPVKDPRGADYKFTGTTAAVSVELFAFMADGKLGFRTFGGAALPFEANILDSRNEVRTDLFSDDTEVAAGVHIALAPLVSKK